MAAVIFHGPPGSYKTSSSIWFEMLGALRAGRIVVTNIEGMKPIDKLEKELGERFPPEADIWRVSTQKRKGLELMRSFYHWCPIGAQIIIDEVQDVFPTERSFKPETYDYRPISEHEDDLPKQWVKTHYQLLENIKPDSLTEADHDDLGEVIFDDNGHIIYPTTLKESFMRHRKYNWDIVVCTPDITQVNMLIRGACEAAFSHSSKDVLGKIIPYFARRPRIRQHPPKENGLQPKKSDIISYRKVPLDVHKLYKSTSTGKVSSSGVGKSPIQGGAFIAGVCFLGFVVIYYALFLGGFFDQNTVEVDTATNQNPVLESGTSSPKTNSVPDSDRVNENAIQIDVFIKLPHEPKEVYLVSSTAVYKNGQYQGVQMVFELVTDKGNLFVDNNKIKMFGVNAVYKSDCYAHLISGNSSKPVFCKPDDPNESIYNQPQQVTQQRDISLFGT